MGRLGDAARMAKMRARRAPFTDARDGRLKRKVRQAFRRFGGKPLTTTELVKHCYWFVGEEIKSWHRTNVSRVADTCHSDRPRDEPRAADHVVATA